MWVQAAGWTQPLTGCWTEGRSPSKLIALPHGTLHGIAHDTAASSIVRNGHESQGGSRKAQVTVFHHLLSEVTSRHSCCVLSVRGESPGPAPLTERELHTGSAPGGGDVEGHLRRLLTTIGDKRGFVSGLIPPPLKSSHTPQFSSGSHTHAVDQDKGHSPVTDEETEAGGALRQSSLGCTAQWAGAAMSE